MKRVGQKSSELFLSVLTSRNARLYEAGSPTCCDEVCVFYASKRVVSAMVEKTKFALAQLSCEGPCSFG